MVYKKERKPQKKKGITKEMKICLILAIIFFLYGVTIKVLAPGGTGFFIVWILMAAIVAVAGVFFQKGIFKMIPMPFKTVGIAVCVVIFCSFLLIEGLVIRQMSMSGRDGLDYVIVLGAQVHKDRPSVVLKYRLDRAAEYLRDNPETICIVSGGQGSNEPYAEAYGMQQYLLQQGIDTDRILIEDQSKTTAENMRFSKKMIPESASVGIITNDFHMFRALQIAKNEGFQTGQICGITAGSTRFFLPNNMLREYLAEIKFLLKKAVA